VTPQLRFAMRAGAVALRGDPASTHGGRHADHRPRGRTARPGRFESPSSTCESLCELTAMREVLPATHAPSPRRNPEAGCSAALNFARHRRFVTDSPLEESGFEPLVPLATEMLIELARGITNPTRMLAVGDIGPVPRLC
jgi:hypothetical protein